MSAVFNIYNNVGVKVCVKLNPSFRMEALRNIRSDIYECPLAEEIL